MLKVILIGASMEKVVSKSFRNIVENNNQLLSVGFRSPLPPQDYQLIEKLSHQNRIRIPQKFIHAKSSGAFGTLKITHDISKYTKASVLQKGEQTPMLARFSNLTSEKDAADSQREIRGFAMKFYTKEGNWDLVGSNTPVFFIKDPLKFPDLIQTKKRNSHTNIRSNTALWDFYSLTPESLHQITMLMSDRGLPKSLRHINGYGSHTYSLINAKNERFWVKFHFKTAQGIETMTNAEAVITKDRQCNRKDLYESIENGNFPKWKFQIQVMTDNRARNAAFNPFDLTKVWPYTDYPLIDVGEIELNRNPENYFSQIDKLVFCPSNLVPGISLSPDKMLLVNRSLPEVNTFDTDGSMNFSVPKKSDDHYSQPRALFHLMNEYQKYQLFNNIAESMSGVPRDIIDRQLALFEKVYPAYAAGVSKALGA